MVASENGYMISNAGDHEKGDREVNVEELGCTEGVMAFERSPPCLAEGPRLVVKKVIYVYYLWMKAYIFKFAAGVW